MNSLNNKLFMLLKVCLSVKIRPIFGEAEAQNLFIEHIENILTREPKNVVFLFLCYNNKQSTTNAKAFAAQVSLIGQNTTAIW